VAIEPTTPPRPLIWPETLHILQDILRNVAPDVYVVGGAVRDAYLQRPLHDIDLITPLDGRPIARKIANEFQGAYYPLDNERRVGRALVTVNEQELIIDVAQFRGQDLLTDLKDRDFTVNAMAVKLHNNLQAVYDPLNGLSDLDTKQLRLCDPSAIENDPVRSLRAIRMCAVLGLRLTAETREAIARHASLLAQSSVERVRDEFLAILDTPKPGTAIRVMSHLGLLRFVVPELIELVGITQAPPHRYDVWEHTLKTVDWLDKISRTFIGNFRAESSPQVGMVSFALHHVREKIQEHNGKRWPNDRTHHALLLFAALMHDVGKATTRSSTDKHVQFHGHEKVGAEITMHRAQQLRLSNEEIHFLTTVVQNHMRPLWLFREKDVSKRAVFRFWRDSGEAGVDVCQLSMADYLATVGPFLDTASWVAFLDLQRKLLESFFQHYETDVAPPPLLTGRQLLDELNMSPGPLVGEILERIVEAQVAGEIKTSAEALEWARRYVARHSEP